MADRVAKFYKKFSKIFFLKFSGILEVFFSENLNQMILHVKYLTQGLLLIKGHPTPKMKGLKQRVLTKFRNISGIFLRKMNLFVRKFD